LLPAAAPDDAAAAKHLGFLRFIKLRQSANRRQMRLRHWLLRHCVA
jgi:hypothetical protein